MATGDGDGNDGEGDGDGYGDDGDGGDEHDLEATTVTRPPWAANGHQRRLGRLDFLERIFREIGFARGESRQRARIAHSAFLGWFELRRVAPHRTQVGRERAAYERAVLELVLAGAPSEA